MTTTTMRIFFYKHGGWVIPLLLFAILTPFTPEIDLSLTRRAYTASTPPGFQSTWFDDFIFDYGLIPGQLLIVTSGVLLFLSCFFKRWRHWYTPSLILVLTLAIGSGLIIHGIFKDHWGRPRPRQVIEFGGTQPFRPFYKPNFFHQPEPSKSFTCGHCSMGFCFFALALVARRYHRPWLSYGALLTAFGLGITLSIVRIEQGGHFFSDTVASALVMWLTAYGITYWIKDDEGTQQTSKRTG